MIPIKSVTLRGVLINVARTWVEVESILERGGYAIKPGVRSLGAEGPREFIVDPGALVIEPLRRAS